MAGPTHLQQANAASIRGRASSLPVGQDLYHSIGGLINIEDLVRRQEGVKIKKTKHYYGLFGSVSPRLRYSPGSEVFESPSQESTPSSHQSEGWKTPLTPQTPPRPKRKRFNPTSEQTVLVTPAPVSRYNRQGQYCYSPAQPDLIEPCIEVNLFELDQSTARSYCQNLDGAPAELAGSLLLPSQGFPQTDPPQVPPYDRKLNCSVPFTTQAVRVPLECQESIECNRKRNHQSQRCPWTPTSPLDVPRMSQHPHHHGVLAPASDENMDSLLPIRTTSLRNKTNVPRNTPPPTPLSKMTIEELMQKLPSLDAAIVVHDWVPCMQKRHQELKGLLQKLQDAPKLVISPNILNEELQKILNKSGDIAHTYHELFEIAKDLQHADNQSKDFEVEDAKVQRSEAILALSRYVAKHKAVCQAHEIDMRELKDQTRQSFETLSMFINQYFEYALLRAPPQQTRQVQQILNENTERAEGPTRHVSSELYHDTQKALKNVSEEKEDLQGICSEQQRTIQEQSRYLDRYVAQMTKIVASVKEQEHQNQILKAEKRELQVMVEAYENAARANEFSRLDREQFQRATSGMQMQNDEMSEQMRAQDAEIANLRVKLEHALLRERDLQSQVRSLLQSSQVEGTNRPSRLKRLLTSTPRASPNLPTLNSMYNLSASISAPFENERLRPDMPPSPSRSSRTSPSLAGLCESSHIADLQLPPPHYGHNRSRSSFEFGPRLRGSPQVIRDQTVDSAVSGRFCRMPSNVQSNASISHEPVFDTRSEASTEGRTEYFRPRLNSAPEVDRRDHYITQGAQNGYEHELLGERQRVLSGITEVTEESGSVQRRSSSPDSVDKRMYLESMRALGHLRVQ